MIESKVASILDKHRVSRHLKVKRIVREEDRFKQTRRGQPGPDTDFKRITKRRFGIEWRTDEKAIAYDHKSDSWYPSGRASHEG